MPELPKVYLSRSRSESGIDIQERLESIGISILEVNIVTTFDVMITTEDGKQYDGYLKCLGFCGYLKELIETAKAS